MKTATKIFDRSNFKNMSPELESEVIRRFNNYDLLVRVMKSVSNSLNTLRKTNNAMSYEDRQDIIHLSILLMDATTPEWQKENSLYY